MPPAPEVTRATGEETGNGVGRVIRARTDERADLGGWDLRSLRDLRDPREAPAGRDQEAGRAPPAPLEMSENPAAHRSITTATTMDSTPVIARRDARFGNSLDHRRDRRRR